MRDYIVIGSTPCGEECAQLGTEGYYKKAMAESKRFIQLLRKTFGDEPFGALLAIKAFDHDFGTYHEVVCYFQDDNEEAMNYAYRCENETPETWDE